MMELKTLFFSVYIMFQWKNIFNCFSVFGRQNLFSTPTGSQNQPYSFFVNFLLLKKIIQHLTFRIFHSPRIYKTPNVPGPQWLEMTPPARVI